MTSVTLLKAQCQARRVFIMGDGAQQARFYICGICDIVLGPQLQAMHSDLSIATTSAVGEFIIVLPTGLEGKAWAPPAPL